MYDALIIGGGVCGSAVAMYLPKYDVKCCLLEKENDIAVGTTKANSGIIHAGYDPEPNTLMAALNVRGNALAEEICTQMCVPYKKVGSLVLAFDQKDVEHIKKLYERGVENGVRGMKLLDRDEVLAREPNISPEVVAALYAPSAGVVNPWRFCIAMAETAAENGVEFFLDKEVVSIEKSGGSFRVNTADGSVYEASYIINCAGVCSDKISAMAGDCSFKVTPSKGEYYLLDKTQSGFVNSVIFQCPTEKGKGVLVSPTADGNIIVGPNAETVGDRDDVSTTRAGLDYVAEAAKKTAAKINYRENIRSFAGIRANTDKSDFIIGESPVCRKFINVAGIKSPGLTSAPAIGEYIVEILNDCGLFMSEKKEWRVPEPPIRFAELSEEEKAEVIKRDKRYGSVICRCCTVTEGEIVKALESRIPPRTVDGIKRRAGTGMGRCQGGFCGPKVHRIISEYYGVPLESVLMDKKGSYIVVGKVGENE